MDLTLAYFNATFRLAAENNMPIHRQLTEYLTQQIRSKVLRPGDRMLAENSIAEALGISRTTVRVTLDHLVEDGLLIRHRGRGSFIAEPRLRRQVNYLYNFTQNIRESGAEPSSQVLQCQVVAADAKCCEKLQLPAADPKVFVLKRLRLADNKPLLLETSRIPYYLCPGIEKFDFSKRSLYATLAEKYALKIDCAAETIAAVIIDHESEKLLGCQTPTPGYRIERIAKLASGVICEYTSSVTRADQCVFELDLRANPERGDGIVFARKFATGGKQK